MSHRHLAALSALALLFGCGRAFVFPLALFRIHAAGGSVTHPTAGNGGSGGNLTVVSSGPISFASDSPIGIPALPPAPTTGTELTNAMITAGTPIAGNVLVSSTLQIAAGVNPATITTNTGDVVIRGSLLGERSAGGTTNAISINAPAGAIHVLGSIRTAGTVGAPDNPNGGNVTLTAQRIYVYAAIDASGLERNGQPGGNGGAVLLDTTGGGGAEILFTGGSILASGAAGTPAGGDGGDVTILAGGTAVSMSSITTGGGAASANGVTPIGGAGGDVTIRGSLGGNIDGTIVMTGGEALGFAVGAQGGNGGTFTAGTAAGYSFFGSLWTDGGNASASAVGAGVLTGGTGGAIRFGVPTPVSSLDVGRGSIWMPGGEGAGGGAGGGGDGGAVDIASLDGGVSIGGTWTIRGGFTPMTEGGTGGSVNIRTDQSPAGNTSNHPLHVEAVIDTSGGTSASNTLGGVGGTAGPVALRCGGNLTLLGKITSTGGSVLNAGNSGHGASVTLQVAAVNLAPTGTIEVVGDILNHGGDGNGGSGDTIVVSAAQGIRVRGSLRSEGRDFGGTGGAVTIQSSAGDIDLSGTLTSYGGTQVAGGGDAGNVTISTVGNITSSMSIDASGGGSFPPQTNSSGADGGVIVFNAGSGSILLLTGSDIRADGGSSTDGSVNPPGGTGGTLLFSSQDQAVTLAGRLSARGGPAGPVASPGGLGGRVVVNTDSDNDGTGGAITLSAGSVIDVSGGTGFIGGNARNNGGVAPADSSGTNLAVVFDAAGGLTSSPDGVNEGIIQNLGTIIATGNSLLARGGDIWFDGRNMLLGDLNAGDGGSMTLTGPAGNGAFFPN